MDVARKYKTILNIALVLVLMGLGVLAASFTSDAMSGLEASGYISSSGGPVQELNTEGSRSFLTAPLCRS